MKNSPDIFKDQPVIGEGEDATIETWVSNWQVVNAWLRTEPDLVSLKKAALYEAEKPRKRSLILERILIRIFKLEKAEALRRLLITK